MSKEHFKKLAKVTFNQGLAAGLKTDIAETAGRHAGKAIKIFQLADRLTGNYEPIKLRDDVTTQKNWSTPQVYATDSQGNAQENNVPDMRNQGFQSLYFGPFDDDQIF